jgi:hypothetical protein
VSVDEVSYHHVCRFVHSYVDSTYKDIPAFGYVGLIQRYPSYVNRLLFWSPEFCKNHHQLIDFIITLGGDGTGTIIGIDTVEILVH